MTSAEQRRVYSRRPEALAKKAAYMRTYSQRPECVERNRLKANRVRAKQLAVTKARRDALLSKQGGVCAICGRADPGPQGWHLDHDHDCCPVNTKNRHDLCDRGTLCGRCNLGIGLLEDDPALLISAANYLAEARQVDEAAA